MARLNRCPASRDSRLASQHPDAIIIIFRDTRGSWAAGAKALARLPDPLKQRIHDEWDKGKVPEFPFGHSLAAATCRLRLTLGPDETGHLRQKTP